MNLFQLFYDVNNDLGENLPDDRGDAVRVAAISFVMPEIWQYACYCTHNRGEHANGWVRYG